MQRYLSLGSYTKEKFGTKLYKLALDGGFTCPNRDGTLGTRGCIFCSGRGSGDFCPDCGGVTAQLEQAKARVAAKNRGGKYIAYFQAFTNTYAPVSHLEQLYREAMAPADIVGLAIGTRPDCLPPEVVELLGRLNMEKPISVELGLQTIHPDSIRFIRRGYENEVYFDAVRRLKEAGLEVVTHIILGLPGETAEMAVQTTKAAVAAKAIPNCNVCFITGSEMQTALSEFLNIMFEVAPASVGGSVPGDDFYCILG